MHCQMSGRRVLLLLFRKKVGRRRLANLPRASQIWRAAQLCKGAISGAPVGSLTWNGKFEPFVELMGYYWKLQTSKAINYFGRRIRTLTAFSKR